MCMLPQFMKKERRKEIKPIQRNEKYLPSWYANKQNSNTIEPNPKPKTPLSKCPPTSRNSRPRGLGLLKLCPAGQAPHCQIPGPSL